MDLQDQGLDCKDNLTFGMDKSDLSATLSEIAMKRPVLSSCLTIAAAYTVYRAGRFAICALKPSSDTSSPQTVVQTREDETAEERQARMDRKKGSLDEAAVVDSVETVAGSVTGI
jgi:hypothetical protein|tara:strand:+ start:1438 stop:1782 length:345 start_codon:yes stop_codon:yes gene_type:complete